MANLAVRIWARVWVRTYQNKIYFDSPVSAHIGFTPAHLFSAGVQKMRARICSFSSCAMFARVVWMKMRRVAKLPTFDLSFATRTRHARLVRLTRARGKRYIRERNALLYDFWYFSSRKSTIKEKYLYVSIQRRKPYPVSATPIGHDFHRTF